MIITAMFEKHKIKDFFDHVKNPSKGHASPLLLQLLFPLQPANKVLE